MTKDQLLDSLASYGYPLLMPKPNEAEEVLENLLEQDDSRLLEGFSVVFFHALQDRKQLEWENPDWNFQGLSKKSQGRLLYFLAFSFLLLQLAKVGENYENRVSKLLSKFSNGKKVLDSVFEPFMKSEPVEVDGVEFSTERLKNAFLTYYLQSAKDDKLKNKKQVLERELLLSELFTPRQKTLLRKRSKGEPFTKTEREYFSRVLKKRLRALADDELHEWAHKLLRQ